MKHVVQFFSIWVSQAPQEFIDFTLQFTCYTSILYFHLNYSLNCYDISQMKDSLIELDSSLSVVFLQAASQDFHLYFLNRVHTILKHGNHCVVAQTIPSQTVVPGSSALASLGGDQICRTQGSLLHPLIRICTGFQPRQCRGQIPAPALNKFLFNLFQAEAVTEDNNVKSYFIGLLWGLNERMNIKVSLIQYNPMLSINTSYCIFIKTIRKNRKMLYQKSDFLFQPVK